MNQSGKAILARLAWRNVIRNWRHSLASMLAIAIGFVAISLFDGFIRGIQQMLEDGYTSRAMLGEVVVFREGAPLHMDEDIWRYSISGEDQKKFEDFLAKDPDFAYRSRHLAVSGMISNGRNSAVFVGFAHDVPEGVKFRGERWGWNTVAGRPLYLGDASSIVLGQGLGKLLDCEARDAGGYFKEGGGYVAEERPFNCFKTNLQLSATTEHAQVNALDATVIGLADGGLREADLRLVAFPLEFAQQLLDTDRITMMSIRVKDPAHAAAFIERARAAARASGLHLDILPWFEHPNAVNMQSTLRMVFLFRNIFFAVLVIVAVLSIANTMMKSVSERIREIGTLRSVGFVGRDLAWMFGCEGFFLAAMACVIGWGAVSLIATLITHSGISYRTGMLAMPVPLWILQDPKAWLATSLVVLVFSSLTAWLTARRATRMLPADALRST